MKQKVFFSLLTMLALTAFTPAMAEDRSPDYTTADGKDWMYNHQITEKRCSDEPKKESNIDLFYIYPTVCMQTTEYSKTHNGFVSIDDEGMRKDTISMSSAKGAFFASGMAFASYTQVYAPYYRQANIMDALANADTDSLLCEYLYKGLAYQDVTDALDYYFTTLNPNGKRPFILAGHSQGSTLLRVLMEHYFSDPNKVALLDNMVACYAIGFGVGKNWASNIESTTGVKFASDTTSSKVYISWNTEGPGSCGVSKLWPKDAIAINPLTWTTDGVAGPEANTGARQASLVDEVRPGLYGAEISNHGTVICREMPARNYAIASIGFGDKCLHGYDYAAYWNNIAENGMQRAAKIAGWMPLKVTGLEEHTYIAQYKYKLQGENTFRNEAVRAGATYWIPKTAVEVQVVIEATEGYKLASGKGNAKVSVDVSDALKDGVVVVDVTGNTAKWDSQRKPDYSCANDWMLNHTLKPAETKLLTQEQDEDTGVDVFFIYPTVAFKTDTTTVNGFVDIDDPQIRGNETTHTDGAWEAFEQQAHVFNGLAYFYMPYYRQMPLDRAMSIGTGATDYTAANQAFVDSLYQGTAYEDITAALDAYFQNWNAGRKFILAAHSQGSALLRNVMEHYFTQDDAHKALLKNLVCSYQLGYGVGQSWLSNLAQKTQSTSGLTQGVQFASDAKGTGCIVSWNVTGPNATGKSILLPTDAVAINPITWTLTNANADKSLNLGTLFAYSPDSIVPSCLSAQVNTQRGTVECAEIPTDQYLDVRVPMFGSKSLHQWDYEAYWENLRQNANERIHTATGKYPIEPTAIESIRLADSTKNQDAKILKDGQVIIYHNGKAYNVLGVEVR